MVREPTTEEETQIALLLCREKGIRFHVAKAMVDDAVIAVCNNYATDDILYEQPSQMPYGTTGYQGRVVIVVWSSGPDKHDVYINRHDGRLIKATQNWEGFVYPIHALSPAQD